MVFDQDLLLKNGAVHEHYPVKEIIFRIGDRPHFYFQILSGTVELNNYHKDGKEFTLNILHEGQGIGESLLFVEKNYPMNAVARTDCMVLKLPRENFLKLLLENKDLSFEFFGHLSERLYYKYVMLFNNSAADPLFKIKELMDYYKEKSCSRTPYSYEMPLTRQQIANLTGLRVETVIRSVQKLKRQGVLKIEGRKILY